MEFSRPWSWLICMCCIYGLSNGRPGDASQPNTKVRVSPADNTPHPQRHSTTHFSKPSVTMKGRTESGGTEGCLTSRRALQDIQSNIQQLNTIIESMRYVKAGTPLSARGQKERCVMKKGKLKCKRGKLKKKNNVQESGTTNQQFRSLHNLFSGTSSSLSSVNHALVADVVSLKLKRVVERFEAVFTEQLDARLSAITESFQRTIEVRFQTIEDSLQTLMRNMDYYSTDDMHETLGEEAVPSIPDEKETNCNPELLSNDKNEVRGSEQNYVIHDKSRMAFTRKLDYKELLQQSVSCRPLVNKVNAGSQTEPIEPEKETEVNEDSNENCKNEFEMLPPLRKLRLEIGISVKKTVLVVLGAALLLLVLGLMVLGVCWVGWIQLANPVLLPPLVAMSKKRRRLSKEMANQLTVVTVSSLGSTNTKVEHAVRTFLRSDPDLRDFRKTTQYVLVGGDRYLGEESARGWGKVLIFLDAQQQEEEKGRGQRFEWQVELKDQLRAMSLGDVCKALGDIVMVVYGDVNSHLLPRGAIYNSSLVDSLLVPALRALCRVGRFLTVHFAFTPTQRLVLKHWLLTPTEDPTESF